MAEDFNPNFREQTLTLSTGLVSLPDLSFCQKYFHNFLAFAVQKDLVLNSLKHCRLGNDTSLNRIDDLKIKCPGKTMVFGPTGQWLC